MKKNRSRKSRGTVPLIAFFLSKLIKMRLHLNKISVKKSVLFSQQLIFFAGLARKFCQELAILIHLQTGRRNNLDLVLVSTSCPTARGDNNLLIYALPSM